MTATGRILIVQSPDGDPSFRDLLHRHADNVPATLLIRGRAGGRRDVWLFTTILETLGKTVYTHEAKRARANSQGLALAWMAALGMRHLVVVDGDVVAPNDLRSLCETATAAGCDVTISLDGPVKNAMWNTLAAWVTHRAPDGVDRPLSPAEFTDVVGAPPPPSSRTVRAPDVGLPDVPDADFLTFRADARSTLPPDEFARVDDVFTDVLTRAGRRRHTSPADVADTVEELLSETTDRNTQTVAFRAVQAALFLQDWHVKADVTNLLDRVAPVANLRNLHRGDGWERTTATMRPFFAAVIALVATGVPPADAPDVALSDVAVDGSTITVPGGPLPVPAGAQAALRAQHLIHRWYHNDPARPFLADGKRPDLRYVTEALNVVSETSGITLRRPYLTTADTLRTDDHRRGTSVTALP